MGHAIKNYYLASTANSIRLLDFALDMPYGYDSCRNECFSEKDAEQNRVRSPALRDLVICIFIEPATGLGGSKHRRTSISSLSFQVVTGSSSSD